MLTATQLQESAVYLSLKYIAILLQSNPTIEGAEGSEYRLFIVAMMLGKIFENLYIYICNDNKLTNYDLIQPINSWMTTRLQTRLGLK